MAKRVEYFIAQRSQRGGGERGDHPLEGAMISRVATIAVALSVAVMILSLAVIFGFQREVHSRLTTLSGDIVVASTHGVNPASNTPIAACRDQIEPLATEAAERYGSQLRQMNSYASRGVILRSAEGVEGVILKGVDNTFSLSNIERGLTAGELPSFGGEELSRSVILASELAAEMGLSVGARLELLTTADDGSLRRSYFRVGALYNAGGGEFERGVIITDLRNVQRLNGWESDQVSGYEISLTNRDRGVEIAEALNLDILYGDSSEFESVAAYATQQLYPALFDWLAALDMNGVVVISIMLTVAIFNIVTALLILVLERVQMIGVLKALGMNNRSLRHIFLLRSLSITLWGLLWGNGVGVALALLQQHFRVVKLDEAGYLLSHVPIDLGVGWIALLNVGVVVAIVAVVTIPTRIVGSIEPHKAIKFQ